MASPLNGCGQLPESPQVVFVYGMICKVTSNSRDYDAMIQMNCPGCGKLLRIGSHHLGVTGQCKRCHSPIKVTVPPGIFIPDAETPSLVMKLAGEAKDKEPVQVHCPECRDAIPLYSVVYGMEMLCNRCGAEWTLDESFISRGPLFSSDADDDLPTPALRETFARSRTRESDKGTF